MANSLSQTRRQLSPPHPPFHISASQLHFSLLCHDRVQEHLCSNHNFSSVNRSLMINRFGIRKITSVWICSPGCSQSVEWRALNHWERYIYWRLLLASDLLVQDHCQRCCTHRHNILASPRTSTTKQVQDSWWQEISRIFLFLIF